LENIFQNLAEHVALALEAISVVVLALGGLEAAWQTLWPLLRGRVSHGIRRAAWLSLARWLVLSLEFMLAADVVRTAIAPDWDAIGKLGAIALIRTFLNYFLERDLKEAIPALDAVHPPQEAS
jgi:uncharacterized membrane protein